MLRAGASVAVHDVLSKGVPMFQSRDPRNVTSFDTDAARDHAGWPLGLGVAFMLLGLDARREARA